MDIGMPELIVVLVIVLLIFGVGRIGSELGQAIKGFRGGLVDQPAGPAATTAFAPPDAPAVARTTDPAETPSA